MKKLDGEVAFITGGASGIGLAMARSLAREGVRIAIADINKAALADAAAALRAEGISALPLALDVRDAASWVRAVDAAEAELGPIFLLCNNAGVGLGAASAEEISPADWNWIISINLGGMFLGVHTIVGRMKARGRGHIVNTSSILGLFPKANHAAYVAAKFAVVGFSETLRAELAPHSIGVTVLMPGLVHTAQSANLRLPQGMSSPPKPVMRPKPGGVEPEIIGDLVVDAVRHDRLYAISHPEYLCVVEDRMQRLLDAFRSSSVRADHEDILYLGSDSLNMA